MIVGENGENNARLKRVWEQRKIPVILRRGGKGQRLRVRLPFSKNSRQWLQASGRTPVVRRTPVVWWKKEEYWELPKAWVNKFVENALSGYGKLYIIQPYREQEKCSPACLNAVGHECQCSCMGENHGAGNDGSWFEVLEAFATRYQDQFLACRLLEVKKDVNSKAVISSSRAI